jgi:hypothetical protein
MTENEKIAAGLGALILILIFADRKKDQGTWTASSGSVWKNSALPSSTATSNPTVAAKTLADNSDSDTFTAFAVVPPEQIR